MSEEAQVALPPQSIEAEQAVLGSILINPEILIDITEILNANDFRQPAHRLIYQAMLDLRKDETPIDALLVSDTLKKRRDGNSNHLDLCGGRQYITDLVMWVATPTIAPHYARVVREYSVARETQRAGLKAAEKINEGADPADVLAWLSRTNAELAERLLVRREPTMSDDLDELFNVIEERTKNPDAVHGVPSGFGELDELTCGFQPGQLIVVAARPSMGKTQTALNMAYNAASAARNPGGKRHEVVFFSLEQPRREILERLIALSEHIDQQALRSGRLQSSDWERVSHASGALKELPLSVVDSERKMSVAEIDAWLKRRKDAGRLPELVVIDHLMHIRIDGTFDRLDLGLREVAEQLKMLAKKYGVAIMLLHQLSRTVESRQNKQPQLSDLRESGALEELADVVAFLYREDYYNKESPRNGEMEIIIAKHRNGPLGVITLWNQKWSGRLFDERCGENTHNFAPVAGRYRKGQSPAAMSVAHEKD